MLFVWFEYTPICSQSIFKMADFEQPTFGWAEIIARNLLGNHSTVCESIGFVTITKAQDACLIPHAVPLPILILVLLGLHFMAAHFSNSASFMYDLTLRAISSTLPSFIQYFECVYFHFMKYSALNGKFYHANYLPIHLFMIVSRRVWLPLMAAIIIGYCRIIAYCVSHFSYICITHSINAPWVF